jgi:hypothetical protein
MNNIERLRMGWGFSDLVISLITMTRQPANKSAG